MFDTGLLFSDSSMETRANTYFFSSRLKVDLLILISLTAPPATGVRSESIKSLAAITTLNSSMSKFAPVRFPAVLEYLIVYPSTVGRDDFRFFWNFITAFQILPCVIETRRYGYIRDSGSRVETPHRATIGCEKFYNGCFHCCGHF